MKNDKNVNEQANLKDEADVTDDNSVAGDEAQQQSEVSDEKSDEKSTDKKEEKKGKKKNDRKAIEKAELQRDEYLSALQRERADFENFKRRNQTAISRAYTDGKSDAAAMMIPVSDNLERAIASADEDSPLKQGIEMVMRQMEDIFEKLGIEVISAESFDPNFHNAVATVPPEEGDEDGQIKEVLMKGYKIGDKVIRHSIVKVVG